ncbi:MAG: Coat F domain protein [Pelotomaculum sp. PtaU1.Bin035]|nr:MAG: Coat F domain protein [Pelotomaculum sp. PtaU1.Bin035]
MLDEKDRLTDSLITQKHIASGYNLAAAEASNTQLKDTFLNILKDEHLIQHEIFNEMSNHGWYQPKPANINDINQNMNKWSQELQRVQSTAYSRPGTQQGNYQASFPQYGFQTGAGMQQMGSEVQHQTMYRPPQNPMV